MRLSPTRWLTATLLACVAWWAVPAWGDDQAPVAEPSQRVGRLIRLSLPISGQTLSQVRRAVRQLNEAAAAAKQRLVLIFEFRVPPHQGDFGRGTEFADAYALANFISGEDLNRFTTVAYLPGSIEGHAVLPVLACDEIVMAPGAEIGSAGIDEPRVDPLQVDAYRLIANRRRTVPAEIALKMLDPERKVFEVETEVGREFVTAEGKEKLRKQHTIKSEKELTCAGRPGQFTFAEARRLFVNQGASTRLELAKALNLPPEELRDDTALGDTWRAARVDLRGPLRKDTIDQAERMIREAVSKRHVNFLCLWIDSPGGAPDESLRLANVLALDLADVRSVAYIPNEARSDAALIALACDQVVVGPQGLLGGWGAADLSADQVGQITKILRQEWAPRKSRSWSLGAALFDPKLEVFRCRSPVGDVEYLSTAELAEQLAPDKWQKGPRVTHPNEPFQARGEEAVAYRLAVRVAGSFRELKEYYGLQDDPSLVEPNWADFLIEVLGSQAAAAVLLVIGFVALYAELHAPGIGVGGFVAAVCFVLFFWSRFLEGTAAWLEISLFLCGLACVVLELFVLPGFGIFGLGGGALILTSLILASQTFVFPHNAYQVAQLERSLWTMAAAAVGVIVAGMMLRRLLPRTPVLGKMVLEPPSEEEAERTRQRESLLDSDGLVGARGVTTTPLVPCGKARFGDRLLDVTTETDLIPRGTPVVVVEVHGNRIVVQATA